MPWHSRPRDRHCRITLQYCLPRALLTQTYSFNTLIVVPSIIPFSTSHTASTHFSLLHHPTTPSPLSPFTSDSFKSPRYLFVPFPIRHRGHCKIFIPFTIRLIYIHSNCLVSLTSLSPRYPCCHLQPHKPSTDGRTNDKTSSWLRKQTLEPASEGWVPSRWATEDLISLSSIFSSLPFRLLLPLQALLAHLTSSALNPSAPTVPLVQPPDDCSGAPSVYQRLLVICVPLFFSGTFKCSGMS
jgi:hypothetical protein